MRRESFKEDPILASIEKYATHSSIKNIKSRMNGVNSIFFKFVDKDQVLKEILKSWVEIKPAKKMIYQSK